MDDVPELQCPACADFFPEETCAQVNCQEDTGACCNLADRNCQDDTPKSSCAGSHQRWHKDLACQNEAYCRCTADTETGACCWRGSGCQDDKTPSWCSEQGGVLYKGHSCDDIADICADTSGIIVEFSSCNPPPETAGDPPASVADIIWEAVQEWEAALQGPELTITFIWKLKPAPNEARAYELSSCCPGDTVIWLNNAYDSWYYDVEPDNRDEYDRNGYLLECSGVNPDANHDLKTVAMHEIGHVLGLTYDGFFPGFRLYSECIGQDMAWTCPPGGPPNPVAQIAPDYQHLDPTYTGQENELMCSCNIERRKYLSWRDAQILETAFGDACGYVNLIPEGESGCPQDTGACCDTSTEACTENTPSGDCQGPDQEWFKDIPCADISCPGQNGDPHCTAGPEWVNDACTYTYTEAGCTDNDPCTFDGCCAVTDCHHVDAGYGDIVSPAQSYGPDGIVDLHDI